MTKPLKTVHNTCPTKVLSPARDCQNKKRWGVEGSNLKKWHLTTLLQGDIPQALKVMRLERGSWTTSDFLTLLLSMIVAVVY